MLMHQHIAALQQLQQQQQQQQQQQPQPLQQQQQQQKPLFEEPQLPPITAARTQPDHHASSSFTSLPRQHHQLDQRRLKSSHGQTRPPFGDERKGGFFPNYTSPAGSVSSPSSPYCLPPKQNKGRDTTRADSGPFAMNSTDQPAITKQISKHSDNCDLSNPIRKASKQKPFALLSRSKSHRDKDNRSPRHTPSPQESKEAAYSQGPLPGVDRSYTAGPTKSAPVVAHDRPYRDAMSTSSRNRSTDRDRAPSRDASTSRNENREREYGRPHQSSSAGRDGNGPASFFNNLKREGGRVAESIGKGLFGKVGRSGSTTDKEPAVDDEHYVLKVINLPLVEQTRLTRISKRLEESRDKTEFWMPAFPWRAIDYLNYKGCDVEGLYRVPGSGPQIKKWQRRFDEHYDVDLFTQEDLYDINIIGSMLKAWLRELPDELFPKEAQDRIARECAGAEKVPQMLIDELSKLSPFNYYLLFAITCHLSLLLAHSDKNKMDFRNLCICFQPCMKIDAFCFKFLVCDWRDCWKGCKTEAKYIEEEYLIFDQPPPPGLGIRKRLEPRMEPRLERRNDPNTVGLDEIVREMNAAREVSSSGSDKVSHHGGESIRSKRTNGTQENRSATPKAVPIYADASNDGRSVTTRGSDDMRPLSPIKPMSPLGF
ncbi:hypothetical protein SLS53_009296 [Cytospora paraplurivora]|uniref:Rho-GAP domain-containing protein n=1 Tax=Cytospora paraplurivora TaxID=2898453 RepID=A0AAN9TX03_9PEZI